MPEESPRRNRFLKTIAALQAKWPEAFFLGAFEG